MAEIIKSIHIIDEGDKKKEYEISFTVRLDGSILIQEEPLDFNDPRSFCFTISRADALELIAFLKQEVENG